MLIFTHVDPEDGVELVLTDINTPINATVHSAFLHSKRRIEPGTRNLPFIQELPRNVQHFAASPFICVPFTPTPTILDLRNNL